MDVGQGLPLQLAFDLQAPQPERFEPDGVVKGSSEPADSEQTLLAVQDNVRATLVRFLRKHQLRHGQTHEKRLYEPALFGVIPSFATLEIRAKVDVAFHDLADDGFRRPIGRREASLYGGYLQVLLFDFRWVFVEDEVFYVPLGFRRRLLLTCQVQPPSTPPIGASLPYRMGIHDVNPLR